MSRNFDLLQRAGKQATLVAESSSGLRLTDSRPRLAAIAGDQEGLQLVQRLFIFPNSHAPRVVVFASMHGDGSSAICSRAGKALAAQGKGSVCVLDGNLRAPSLHELCGIERAPGLSDVEDKRYSIGDFAVPAGTANLWVIPSGSPAQDVQRIFGSGQMPILMEKLRKQFDYVLIEAPPLSTYSDAILLGQMADGIVLILEANSTRRDDARIVQHTLKSANVKLLGAILNNRKFPIPESIFRKL